jgi:hypothetical protein
MRKVFLAVLGLLLTAGSALAATGLTELIVPQYMEAANSSTRLPAMFRVTLTDLTPGATYRYWMGAVIATDAATANGAGNPLFMDDSYTFYTTSTGMATPGSTCSQLTADAAGSYTGWMGLVGTANARFTAGNTVYLRVMLNDGAGGTTVATRLTTTSGVKTVALGTTTADGTGVFQLTAFTPKDVVLLYDNTGGIGRPLATAVVQNEGATVASAAAFYSALEGTAGAWGTILPNTLPTGLMRIEERAYATGDIVQSLIDLDGVWNPGAIDTVDPAGGTTAIDLTGVTSEEIVPTARTTFGSLKVRYR